MDADYVLKSATRVVLWSSDTSNVPGKCSTPVQACNRTAAQRMHLASSWPAHGTCQKAAAQPAGDSTAQCCDGAVCAPYGCSLSHKRGVCISHQWHRADCQHLHHCCTQRLHCLRPASNRSHQSPWLQEAQCCPSHLTKPVPAP